MSRNLPCRVTSSTSVPVERRERRVEGLQRAERGDVDLRDRAVGEPAPQVEGQRFHLGQLGHGASLGCAPPCPAANAGGSRLATEHNGDMTSGPSASRGGVDLPRRPRERPRAAGLAGTTTTGLVVLSLWRDNVCAGSFRLAVDEVPELIAMLRAGLDGAYDVALAQPGAPAAERPAAGLSAARLTRSTPTVRNLRRSAREPDTVLDRGPDPEPLRPRRRPAPARARRSRRAARAPSTSCWSGWPAGRPGAQPGADRAARGRQDGAAQRAALGRRAPPVGHRQARGPPRPGPAPAAVQRAAPGGARARAPAGRRRRPRARGDQGLRPARRRAPRPSCATSGAPASTCPRCKGRADSGDIEIDLVELFTDVGGLAGRRRQGHRGLHRRDAGPRARRRLGAVRGLPRDQPVRAAGDRGRRRAAAPAGGAVGQQVLLRAAVPLPAHRPARPRGRRPGAERAGRGRGGGVRARTRSPRCTPRPAATRTSSRPTARWCGTSRRAPRSRADDVAVAAPEAEAELAVGFFGSRYERATPGEREYLRAMADAAVAIAEPAGRGARRHPERADRGGRRPCWARSRSRSRRRATRC